MVRLMGFPILKTNSSHASSSGGPAQRHTTSFRERDEYRVNLGVFNILFPIKAVDWVSQGATQKVTNTKRDAAANLNSEHVPGPDWVMASTLFL